ncbi:MAG: hypothetical protein WD294_08280, partial [Phycisphaeraceae bacterium]
ACQSTPQKIDAPLTVMLDREAYPDVRRAAAAQAAADLPDDESRLAALEILLTQPGHGRLWQQYALDELAAADEDRTITILAAHLHTFSSWDTVSHALDLAVTHDWPALIPAIVRRYAAESRRYPDVDRPERAALQTLAPNRTVEEIAFAVFTDADQDDIRERAAAFTLYARLIDDHDQTIAELTTLETTNDTLVLDLQAAAAELNIIPNNLETLTWLRLLRTGLLGNLWQVAAPLIADFTPAQRQGLALRHLPILAYTARTEPAVLAHTQKQLYTQLQTHLASADTHGLGSTVDALADHPQQLAAYRDQLAWADLLTLRLITQMMADRTIVDQWFAQADADHADTTTELGGLILPNQNLSITPVLYEPSVRRHPKAYYAPPELIFDGYTALAHYHFHAQEHNNRRYAGPGDGDLQRIGDRHQFNGLVLTFIDRNRLNVDYYQTGRIVVDLGTIHR